LAKATNFEQGQFMKIHCNSFVFLAIIFICSIAQTESRAHDEHVHMKITEGAFQSSTNLNSFLIDSLGSDNTSFNLSPTLLSHPTPFNYGIGLSPLNWLRQGSYWEDMTLYGGYQMRCVDHFYTVWPGRTPGRADGLTDESEPWFASLAFPDNLTNSFVWGSQQNITGPRWFSAVTGPNSETWQDARSYEYLFLTSRSKADRNEYIGHMLFALGHVLHLNQDTSQPDHVRNDNHKNEERRFIEDYGYNHFQQNPQWFNPQPHGWSWWQTQGFTKLLDFWDRGLYVGNSQPLSSDANGALGHKLGLAEACNGNFLGEDALYKEMTYSDPDHHFPLPSRDESTNFKNIQYKLVEGMSLIGAYDVTTLKDGTLVNRIYLAQFYGISLNHQSVMGYLNTAYNVYAGAYGNDWIVRASLSINDPKVLQEYHDILIPKAVEYSAGILDYFFRGSLEVSFTPNSGNSSYTLHIVNKSGQAMQGGAFHLYYDDSTGIRTELTGSDFNCAPFSSIPDVGAIDAIFTPQALAQGYTLVYKGSIGSTDPVDTGFAVASKSFAICELPKKTAPKAFSELATMYGPTINFEDDDLLKTTTTASFVVPAAGGVVAVAVDDKNLGQNFLDSTIIGEIDFIEGVGEFVVVGYNVNSVTGKWTLTLQNNGIPSNVSAGTVVPAGAELTYENNFEPTKTVFVPSVNRLFTLCASDVIAVYNPDTLQLVTHFHIRNSFDAGGWEAYSMVYACDVDRLYIGMNDGYFYLVNPHTYAVDQVISWRPNSYHIHLDDGFFDPANHHIGFGYMDEDAFDYTMDESGFVVINTLNNAIVNDTIINTPGTFGLFINTAYSPPDNKLYTSDSVGIFRVYSADAFDKVSTVYTPTRTYALKAVETTAEIYGADSSNNRGFSLAASGAHTDSTTAGLTTPAIGGTVNVSVNDTSGMLVGGDVVISSVTWRIDSVASKTAFVAKNISVNPPVVISSGASVSWAGPKYNGSLPAMGNVYQFSYSSVFNKLFYPSEDDSTIWVVDPATKTISSTLTFPDLHFFQLGCDGPSGNVFFPVDIGCCFPYLTGVTVLH
jgi:hypothetical protein